MCLCFAMRPADTAPAPIQIPRPAPDPRAALASGNLGSRLVRLATIAAAIHRASAAQPPAREPRA